MYISAVLKTLGHDVKVVNYNLRDYNLEDELKGIQVVLFTGFEEFRGKIIEDAKVCQENGIKTVLGGALATFTPNDSLKFVDIIVIGEGEDVLKDALNGHRKVQGVRFRRTDPRRRSRQRDKRAEWKGS